MIFKKINSISWGVSRRLEFIEQKILWEERINRKDLMAHFRISVPQASSDLRMYQEFAPKNLEYDKSGKFYFPSPKFKPILINPSPEHYLNQLSEISSGRLDPSAVPISLLAPCYSIPFPERSIVPNVFRTIVKVIKNNIAIHIKYQSITRPNPVWRWISPTAFGNDGFRWHVRAFCHKTKLFKDFIFGRILEISGEKPTDISSEDDIFWNTQVDFIIAPHPNLKDSKKKTIEIDYGMVNSELKISVKGAFIFYFKKRFGFSIDHEKRNPDEQHIILKNADEVNEFICSTTEKQKQQAVLKQWS